MAEPDIWWVTLTSWCWSGYIGTFIRGLKYRVKQPHEPTFTSLDYSEVGLQEEASESEAGRTCQLQPNTVTNNPRGYGALFLACWLSLVCLNAAERFSDHFMMRCFKKGGCKWYRSPYLASQCWLTRRWLQETLRGLKITLRCLTWRQPECRGESLSAPDDD